MTKTNYIHSYCIVER